METLALRFGLLHRVLKWALFFSYYFLGRLPVLWWLVDAPPICHQCHLAKNEMWGKCALLRLRSCRSLSVLVLDFGGGETEQNLPRSPPLRRDSTKTTTVRRLNLAPWTVCYIRRLISEATSPCQSNASSSTVYKIIFCILCLCLILCDTSKASENLTFLTVSFCRVFLLLCIVWVPYMKIKDCT